MMDVVSLKALLERLTAAAIRSHSLLAIRELRKLLQHFDALLEIKEKEFR